MENNNKEDIQWGAPYELFWIGIGIIIAGFIAKIPQFQGQREDLFYQRNLSFIFLPLLMVYFIWKNKQTWKNLFVPAVIIIIAAFYINFLPNNLASQTNQLAFFHLPIMIWCLVGFVFLGSKMNGFKNGVQFIRYTGDLMVMSALILLSGFLFMAMTMGLFKLIGIDTVFLVQHYVLVWGLPAIPIIGTYIVQNNPQVVNKISPIIAKIFTPMVTLMLFLFLLGIIVTGKNPTKDREFLMIFNGLLIGVMALIIFSLSEMTKKGKKAFQLYNLLALSLITILLNSIALYAIVFRFMEYGFSANRIAVLGADLLIFTHLILLTRQLYLLSKEKSSIIEVEEKAGKFLFIYFIWTAFIVFLLPFLYNFN